VIDHYNCALFLCWGATAGGGGGPCNLALSDPVNCFPPAEPLPRGLPHRGEARVSLCPWGHQQTGTLRLESPRARGGGIILACLALRSPKSRPWVPAARRAPEGTEDTRRYVVPTPNPPSRRVSPSPGHPSFQPEAGARTSPGPLLCCLPGGSLFPPSHGPKPQLSAQSSGRAARKPSSTDYRLVTI